MPIGIPVLEGIGTYTMRVRMDRPAVDTPNHRPVPDTEPLRLLDYVENVEAGFVEAYEVFRRHRASLLEPGGPLHAFADAEVRVIPRGTMLYATIRQTGFHPSLLSDALRRDEHFDCLWRNAPDQPTLANLIPAEQRDLWENDIPFFSASVDGTVLRDSTGATVPGVELKPGIVRIREAVDNLGTADQGRQLWLLRGSLATTVIDASQVMAAPSYELRLGLEPPPPHRLTAGAARIGDHLACIAVDEGDHAQWLGVNSSRGRTGHWVHSDPICSTDSVASHCSSARSVPARRTLAIPAWPDGRWPRHAARSIAACSTSAAWRAWRAWCGRSATWAGCGTRRSWSTLPGTTRDGWPTWSRAIPSTTS
jgi:lantibiotic modifying enzyme